ncbi:MAG: nucleotidyltransferase domain-containing protein [Conexivisphaerales archaeon]
MKLEQEQGSILAEIVNTISSFKEVIGIILFGSRARGDYDEYSDYDVIVLFASKDDMWKEWDSLFEATSRMKINLHVIPQTIEELKSANPAFLEELNMHGRLLYAKYPFEAFFKQPQLKEHCILSYDMSHLSYRKKMKIEYELYGKGMLKKLGGKRLGKGVLILPSSSAKHVAKMLEEEGASVQLLSIFIPD